MKISQAFIISVLLLSTITLTAAGNQKADIKDVSARFEKEILNCAQQKEFRDAIIKAAEYEQDLIFRYPPASFQNNFFQSEAEHMTFSSSFTDWKKIGLKELEIPEWLPMMGFNILLAQEGKVEEDRFIALTMNMGQIEQRMGLSEPGQGKMTDQELLLGGTMIANQFGAVTNQQFKTFGDHSALVMKIGSAVGGPPITMINLANGRRFYSFVLISSLRNQQDNENKLNEVVKTLKFDYKPANTAQIKAIRDKITDKNALEPRLKCIAELAAMGEYNAASEELANLRTLLSQRMQKPIIKDNTAEYPDYGVALKNPDDTKWKLSVEDMGGTKMLLLEEKWSVKNEGIAILILDTIMAYGPQAAKAFENDEQKKDLLTGGGRGSALSIGTSIESEQFSTFKGGIAYEAVVVTNMPGLKAKCIWTLRPGFMLGVLMLADTNSFQKKITEYEKIITSDALKI
ncbi:MAG: hypothetical protein JW715_03210 [Sedimentisphaerales bacterium]|nr:hypothetical protein [Sedimentisphaerales bacterium]